MEYKNACIAKKLSQTKPEELHALVGFDGYIDELLRVVERGDSQSGYGFYKDIPSFAARLAQAAGKSADIEIVPTDIKLGGNAPIMANALTQIGVSTTCIGAMGAPKLQEVFAGMAQKCTCISLCEPAYTHALEFEDGKLMLANLKSLDQLHWDRIKGQLGLAHLIELFDSMDLIALVNWSGVSGSEDTWAGIYREVLPNLKSGKKKFFFDLADPTKKAKEEILSVMNLIRSYSAYGDVFLGLNENEALRLSHALGEQRNNLEQVCESLHKRLQITAVIIHPIDRCIAADGKEVITEYGTVVKEPRISTGGGDNFNAGFCLGALLGLPLRESMRLGMATSGFYVKNGYSPTLADLTESLQ